MNQSVNRQTREERNLKQKKTCLKYVVYARRSTEDEERQQLSIPSQLDETKKFAKTSGLTIVDTLFESKTAKKPGRTIFNKLLSMVSSNEADGIIAWHPDRLARNAVDAGAIMHLLDTGKLLDLKFPSFWFEDTSQGKFMLSMAFSQSKYYVDSLSENTKRGLRAKVKKGEMPGLAPVGYMNDRLNKTIVVDKKTSKVVKKLFSTYSKGKLTMKQGARLLLENNIQTRNGRPFKQDKMKFILSDPFYYGHFMFKGELHKGAHMPLISKSLFDKVQKVIKGKSFKIPKPGLNHPFTGLIECGECGMMITAEQQIKHYKTTSRTVKYVYYRCTRKHKTKVCHNSPINQDRLLPQINQTIKELALPKGWKDRFLEKLDEEERQVNKDTDLLTKPIKQRLEELKPKQDRILNAFVDGVIPQEIYLSKKNELVSQKRSLEEKLTSLIINPNSWIEPFRDWILLADSANKLSKSNTKPEEKREFLRKTGLNLFLQERKLRRIQQNPWSALRRRPTSRNMVPGRGIEPPRDCSHWILNPARLPVPPSRRVPATVGLPILTHLNLFLYSSSLKNCKTPLAQEPFDGGVYVCMTWYGSSVCMPLRNISLN
jgi:site-specific DNA recombinase